MRTLLALGASIAVHVLALGAFALWPPAQHAAPSAAPAPAASTELLFVDVASARGLGTREDAVVPAAMGPASASRAPERVAKSRRVVPARAPASSQLPHREEAPARGSAQPSESSEHATPATPAAPGTPATLPASAGTASAPPPASPANAQAASDSDGAELSAGSSTGAGAPNGSGQGRGGEAVDLAALHARLAAAARGCYPPAAKRFRLTGTVPVHFCVDASGALSSIDLRGSSGSALLDRAAKECVLPRAAPLQVPPSCFDVPVAFR